MLTASADTSRQRAAVIILAANRVLLIHRYKQGRDYYVVPGGGVAPGESFAQAAVREIKEETGLAVELDRKLGAYQNQGQPEQYFLATRFSGTLALDAIGREYLPARVDPLE